MLRCVVLSIFFTLTLSTPLMVAGQDAGTRARDLAAALDKTKYKKKEKHDIKVEIYVEIKNVPVSKSDLTWYSGTYECGEGSFGLELRVGSNGDVTATGWDGEGREGRRNFTIRDGRIDGALLRGTRVFGDGRTEPFEAVFVNRTARVGKNVDSIETVDTAFGLGFFQENGGWSSRVFLERE